MSERAVFLAALELDDPTARAAYLDAACAGDPALLLRVEALLRCHEQAGTFLDVPAVDQASAGPGDEAVNSDADGPVDP
jgi:hypothetical protein